jgi:3',5'-cyclic AMP phosphodiesterase CpdA
MTPRTTARDRAFTVVAVGDIACPPGMTRTSRQCHQADTAALTEKIGPDAVLALGDMQYESGALSDFRHSYAESWGALKSITYPVPGNHEYRTAGAAGYYHYFRHRQPGAPGYYTTTLGSWRLYALNSNCDLISCGREARWLRRKLDKHPSRCALLTMHHPRYSSGSEHGSDPLDRRFFRIADRRGVEVALAGHDHDYERFRRMDADGHVTKDGIMQFVSGLGGRSIYPFGRRVPGSAYQFNHQFGVLKLRLERTSYHWAFKTVGGTTLDEGHRACR